MSFNNGPGTLVARNIMYNCCLSHICHVCLRGQWHSQDIGQGGWGIIPHTTLPLGIKYNCMLESGGLGTCPPPPKILVTIQPKVQLLGFLKPINVYTSRLCDSN